MIIRIYIVYPHKLWTFPSLYPSHQDALSSTTQSSKNCSCCSYAQVSGWSSITADVKYSQKWSYHIALNIASSQKEKILFFFFFSRHGIWNNAWSKNQTRNQNFEIQASNSLSNLAGLALLKFISNWHCLWWSPLTGGHCRAAGGCRLQAPWCTKDHTCIQHEYRARKSVRMSDKEDQRQCRLESSDLLHWIILRSSRKQ